MLCTKKDCPAGSTDRARLFVMLVGLHKLRIGESVGAPKPSSSGGHGGVRFDSGRHTVAIILISRLLVITDEDELQRIAQSRYGLVLLERIREVVLQLASPSAPSLQLAQVQTLFNTVGSTLKREGVYKGLLGLPGKLPFEQAKKVYAALLNAVASERGGDVGTQTVQVLRSAGNAAGSPPSSMADAVVANFAKQVRQVAAASMASGEEASASAQPPPPPALPPPPSAAIVPTSSFLVTLANIAAAHVGHALSAAEHAQARSAFDAAFNVLSSLGPSERAQLLHSGVLDALLDADAAQLYTCVLAAAKEGALGETLDALLQRVDDQATAAAGAGMMLTAAGWGIDGIGVAHPIGLATATSIGVSTALHLAPEPIDQTLTEVRASTIPGAGRGLFATRDIPAGMVVAGMEKSARMKRSIWRDYHRYAGLPHDAAIYVARSPLVFYDAAWTDPSTPPKWYRLNHSETPNLFMGLLDPSKPPRSQALVWRTKRPIRPNEELFFTYEDVPPEW